MVRDVTKEFLEYWELDLRERISFLSNLKERLGERPAVETRALDFLCGLGMNDSLLHQQYPHGRQRLKLAQRIYDKAAKMRRVDKLERLATYAQEWTGGLYHVAQQENGIYQVHTVFAVDTPTTFAYALLRDKHPMPREQYRMHLQEARKQFNVLVKPYAGKITQV